MADALTKRIRRLRRQLDRLQAAKTLTRGAFQRENRKVEFAMGAAQRRTAVCVLLLAIGLVAVGLGTLLGVGPVAGWVLVAIAILGALESVIQVQRCRRMLSTRLRASPCTEQVASLHANLVELEALRSAMRSASH